MKFSLFVFELSFVWTLNRVEVSSNPTILAQECTKSYCYHFLEETEFPVSYRRQGRNWPHRVKLQHTCRQKVSQDSWPLEIYDLEEQLFLEKFISENIPRKISWLKEDPVLIPLNLNVSFKNGWSWFNGDEEKVVDTHPGEYYAYAQINRSTLILDGASSDVASHFGLCHIPRIHCKELRSSHVIDGQCFYKVRERSTWHQSRWQCHQRKGELSSIIPGFLHGFSSSSGDSSSGSHRIKRVVQTARVQGDFWVGLSHVEEKWIKKNQSAIYTNWGGETLEPLQVESDFAFLESDSKKWSVKLPHKFELKVVCMTENNKNNNNNNNNDRIPTKPFVDTCHVTITWLIMATVGASIVALTFAIFYSKGKLGFTFRPLERSRKREDLAILEPFEELNHDGFDFTSSHHPINGALTKNHHNSTNN